MRDWPIFNGRPTAPSSEAAPAAVPCHHPNHLATQRPSATTPVPTLGTIVGHPHWKAEGVISPSGPGCSPPE
jgi:hypothetical protein